MSPPMKSDARRVSAINSRMDVVTAVVSPPLADSTARARLSSDGTKIDHGNETIFSECRGDLRITFRLATALLPIRRRG